MGKACYATSQLKKKTSRKLHRACCVFVDIAFFLASMSGVQPFQFEPKYPPGEEPDDSEKASGESDSELYFSRRIGKID